ncbi:hypothetical protein EIK56_17895 [Sphingomonas sp. C8-2]|nr:hypothetical protein EIK56_17895 [Sphingomonas sp. C8-2]
MTTDPTRAAEIVAALIWQVEQVCGPLSTKPSVVKGDDDRSVLEHNFRAILARFERDHMQRPTDTARAEGIVIERAVADDLVRAIYEREGWNRSDKGGFESCSARCNSLYIITADPRRNRYVARKRTIDSLRPTTPSPVTDETALSGEAHAELRRDLFIWKVEMERSAREMRKVPGLGEAADGTDKVARLLSRAHAALASTPQPASAETVERARCMNIVHNHFEVGREALLALLKGEGQ